MSADPSPHPLRDGLGMAALVAVPVLCCAGPALLAAGALGVLGSWLLSPWLIGAAVLLALGAVAWRLRPRSAAPTATGGAATSGALCCPPAAAPADPESAPSRAGTPGSAAPPRAHTGRTR